MTDSSAGPLAGVRVLELGGIGPGPFAGMLLGDLGAEVIRIDSPAQAGRVIQFPILFRNRRSVAIDLKNPAGVELALRLAEDADAIIEGFRPGVAERLGVGPEPVLARNPRIAYGRMTGWGQDGPLAAEPGHDINFIALTGVLHAVGPAERPVVPLNLAGDMGGGGMLLALGLLGAIISAHTSRRGQVVDAAMNDGAATLLTMVLDFRNQGRWRDERAANAIDGGSPCYTVYRCADGGHVALGVGDERSYTALLDVLRLGDHPDFRSLRDRASWPRMRKILEEVFARRDRDEWEAVFAGRGACVTPVLSMAEASRHPHNRARGTFREDGDGRIEPAPAPRFSRTPAPEPWRVDVVGVDTDAVLIAAGVPTDRLTALRAAGVVG